MTMTVSQPDELSSPGPGRVVRVTGRYLLPAAQRLVSASAQGTQAEAMQFIQVASANALDLHCFWAFLRTEDEQDLGGKAIGHTHEGGEVGHVALAMGGTGRTAVMFTSVPASRAEERELALVIDRACNDLQPPVLAQTLLPENELGASPAYEQAGFEHVADLAYMRRPMPALGDYVAPEQGAWPAGVEVVREPVGRDDELMEALERSYIDTLDCPRLCGVRSTADVLASHKATGQYKPEYWWLIRKGGKPEGAMLFNPNPMQSSVELVYVGIGPALRGSGVGKLLMQEALAAISGRPEAYISCAVDSANTPARKLYDRFGFVQYARRRALIRHMDAAQRA